MEAVIRVSPRASTGDSRVSARLRGWCALGRRWRVAELRVAVLGSGLPALAVASGAWGQTPSLSGPSGTPPRPRCRFRRMGTDTSVHGWTVVAGRAEVERDGGVSRRAAAARVAR